MNKDEQIVNTYLENKGFTNIIFEPDGNIPPDFLCDHEIAIEVRRLNKYIKQNNQYKPIEELSYKLIPRLLKLLKLLSTDFPAQNITVSIIYERPLKVDEKLINTIKNKLYSEIPYDGQWKIIDINKNLRLKLYNSKIKQSVPILLGGINDLDTGGSIVSMILQNMEFAIKEKEDKISEYKDNYKTWWLILVNHVWDDLDDDDVRAIHNSNAINTVFDKVLLVSPSKINNEIVVNINSASA